MSQSTPTRTPKSPPSNNTPTNKGSNEVTPFSTPQHSVREEQVCPDAPRKAPPPRKDSLSPPKFDETRVAATLQPRRLFGDSSKKWIGNISVNTSAWWYILLKLLLQVLAFGSDIALIPHREVKHSLHRVALFGLLTVHLLLNWNRGKLRLFVNLRQAHHINHRGKGCEPLIRAE